jgi:cytoskeletal protein CcmA (bactofilin family)
MFAKRNKRPRINTAQLCSLIAADVVITGDVCFGSGLRIDGCVNGNVFARSDDSAALLVLSQTGRINGSVRCADAVINGAVVGDLQVDRFVELQSESRISGTLRYQQLQMDVGAVVRGQLHDIADAPANDNVVELGADKPALAERR